MNDWARRSVRKSLRESGNYIKTSAGGIARDIEIEKKKEERKERAGERKKCRDEMGCTCKKCKEDNWNGECIKGLW